MTTKKYHKRPRGRSQKTKKKTKPMNKVICSPTAKKKKYTCYSDDALITMRELWNARHPDVKIEATAPNKIWSSLRETCNMSVMSKAVGSASNLWQISLMPS